MFYLWETHLEKLGYGGYMAGTGTLPGIGHIFTNLNTHCQVCVYSENSTAVWMNFFFFLSLAHFRVLPIYNCLRLSPLGSYNLPLHSENQKLIITSLNLKLRWILCSTATIRCISKAPIHLTRDCRFNNSTNNRETSLISTHSK